MFLKHVTCPCLEDTEVWGYAMAKEQCCSGGVECWTGLKERMERHTLLVAFGKGVMTREAGWCRMTTIFSFSVNGCFSLSGTSVVTFQFSDRRDYTCLSASVVNKSADWLCRSNQ